jgi:hypothetical protein
VFSQKRAVVVSIWSMMLSGLRRRWRRPLLLRLPNFPLLGFRPPSGKPTHAGSTRYRSPGPLHHFGGRERPAKLVFPRLPGSVKPGRPGSPPPMGFAHLPPCCGRRRLASPSHRFDDVPGPGLPQLRRRNLRPSHGVTGLCVHSSTPARLSCRLPLASGGPSVALTPAPAAFRHRLTGHAKPAGDGLIDSATARARSR